MSTNPSLPHGKTRRGSLGGRHKSHSQTPIMERESGWTALVSFPDSHHGEGVWVDGTSLIHRLPSWRGSLGGRHKSHSQTPITERESGWTAQVSFPDSHHGKGVWVDSTSLIPLVALWVDEILVRGCSLLLVVSPCE